MGDRSDPLAKLSKKLGTCHSRGDFYEAQQLCLSLHSRWKKKDRRKAHDILASGARALLEREEIIAGSELAVALCKEYLSDGVEAGEARECVVRLDAIFAAYPRVSTRDDEVFADLAALHAEKVVNHAMRWYKRCDSVSAEEVKDLHLWFAVYLNDCLGIASAFKVVQHFLKSGDVQELAKYLRSIVTCCGEGEEDLFIAKVALMVIGAGIGAPTGTNHAQCAKDAQSFLDAYEFIPETPLVHFIQLFIKALSQPLLLQRAPLASLLQEKYSVALNRDPSLAREVARIVNLLQGGGPGRGGAGAGGGGMMADMLQNLFT